MTPETTAHYRDTHAGHFDISRAEELLPGVLADPLMVYQGKKAKTLVFVGEYDAQHLLIVPIKALPDQLWLESLYIDTKRKFEKRKWVQNGPLYRKNPA